MLVLHQSSGQMKIGLIATAFSLWYAQDDIILIESNDVISYISFLWTERFWIPATCACLGAEDNWRSVVTRPDPCTHVWVCSPYRLLRIVMVSCDISVYHGVQYFFCFSCYWYKCRLKKIKSVGVATVLFLLFAYTWLLLLVNMQVLVICADIHQ